MREPIASLVVLVTVFTLTLSVHAGYQVPNKDVKGHGGRTQEVSTQDESKKDVSSHNAGTQDGPHQDLVRQSKDAYYNLARHGFKGFKATIEPNWEVILAHTATPENLEVFRAVRFAMVVDAKGAITIKHEVTAILTTPKMQLVVNQIHYHIQRLVAGFFSTWRMFMVDSPFPDTDTQIKVENVGNEYRLSYSTQSGEVTMMMMSSDLLITEWSLVNPRAMRTVKPHFQKTAEGFLLTGYKGDFEPITQGTKAALDFNIEYQDFNGMKLPHKVRLGGLYGSEPVEAELVFRVN